MTKDEEAQILSEYEWATSRLASKMIPALKKTYNGMELVDLIMALPIKFHLSEMDADAITPGVPWINVMYQGYIARNGQEGVPDQLVVNLVLTKKTEMSWEKFFKGMFDGNEHASYAAFIYLHEAMHLLLKHHDYYLNDGYESIIDNYRPELSKEHTHELLNHAYDYWINGYMIDTAEDSSVIHSFKNDANFGSLYDTTINPEHMSQQEIVVKLVKEAKIEKEDLCDSDGNSWGTSTTITINGNSSTTININAPALGNISRGDQESASRDISEVVGSTRDNLLDKSRGNESQGALTKLGVDFAVPIDWFSHLKGSIFNIVQRYTSTYEQTWGKMKNKMRHICPMPGRVYKEKKLAAVISIDQSGSMSDHDLEKINYVVNALSKKTTFTEILLHDTAIGEAKRFIGSKPANIREFITNRVACGGTSHKCIFDHISELISNEPKTKFIYLSFSDNWSDIEQTFPQELFKDISCYWITTDENNTVDVPGMQISLENGVLSM